MRYDTEHKEKTRKRVLKEAAKAIREVGPERVAVASIMAEAGLTHGGFYAHFKSKEALVHAAIEEMFEESRGNFARSTEGHAPDKGMVRYIDFYLSPRHRDALGTGCPITTLAADLPRLDDAARHRYGEGVARLTAKVSEQLERLGRSDSEPLAQSVVAELVGALAMSRGVEDREQSDAILSTSRAALKRRLGLGEVT